MQIETALTAQLAKDNLSIARNVEKKNLDFRESHI